MKGRRTGRPSHALQIVAAVTSLASVVFYCLAVVILRSLEPETAALSGSELLFACAYLLVPLGSILFSRLVTDEVWRWSRLLVLVLSFLSGLYAAAAVYAFVVFPPELASLGFLLVGCAVNHMVALSVMCIRSSPPEEPSCTATQADGEHDPAEREEARALPSERGE